MPNFQVHIEKKKTITVEGRCSYVSLLETRQYDEDDKPSWGMRFDIPKDSPGCADWIGELKKMFAKIILDKFGQEKGMKLLKAGTSAFGIPLRDGDNPAEADKDLEGYWFMNVKNTFRRPHIIGPAGKPLQDHEIPEEYLYSGMFGRCLLDFYWYGPVKGNQGVGCSISGFMKTKDGERLDGAVSETQAEGFFSDFADGVAAMTTGIPGSEPEAPEDFMGGGDTPADTGAGSKDDDEGFNFM